MAGGRRCRGRYPGSLDRGLVAEAAAVGCWGRPQPRADRPGAVPPLVQTAAALTSGELSPAHAGCWPPAPTTCPPPPRPRRSRCSWRRPDAWTHRGCGGSSPTCGWSLTPTAGTTGLPCAMTVGAWLAPTFEGMVALQGLLGPEAGRPCWPPEPLARPASAEDDRSGGQRHADALTELARRAEAGRLPQTGGVRPQLLVTVDLHSLLGHPGAVGGEGGWTGPLDPEACRRLACDGAVTRVLVTRHPSDQQPSATNRPSAAGRTWGRSYGPRWRCSHQSWVGPPPAAGGRAGQPGRPARPTRRPGRPRRRLCVPGL